MNIQFDRTGIILYVKKYEACINFYKEVLGLKVLFDTDMLTCFAFGEAYLMVEVDDKADREFPEGERLKTCLRMNVSNIKEITASLQAKGLDVDYQEHDWGIVAKLHDPDGNLCAFKDSQKFEKQVLEGEE